MALAKSTTDAFLARELGSHEWIKELSIEELQAEAYAIAPEGLFLTKPRKHQLAGFLIGTAYNGVNFWFDPGLGKSLLAILLFGYHRHKDGGGRALVVVPNTVNLVGWEDQILEHQPSLSCVLLSGTDKKRWDAVEGEGDIFVITYAGLRNMLSTKEKIEGKNKQVPDSRKIEKFGELFNFICADEAQNVKNPESLSFQIVGELSGMMDYRYGLTGTPFGRDPIDLWSQMYIVDFGETLGGTLELYRDSMFNFKLKRLGKRRIPEWHFDKKHKPLLHQWLKNSSLRYDETEVEDLPPFINMPIKIEMPKEVQGDYNELRQKLLAEAGGKVTAEKRQRTFMAMRQLSAGFIMDEDGNACYLKAQPKLEALIHVLEEIPEDRQILIFHEFTPSGDLIEKALDKAKVKHLRLYGGTNNKGEVIREFQTNPKVRVLNVNSGAGGTGVNAQMANYMIFYERNSSPIVRSQTEHRVHRIGQTRSVFCYDLIMNGTVDERIQEFLKEGKDLSRAVLDGDVSCLL